MVVVEPGESFGLGRDLDEVGGVPRPAQRDGRLVEEVVHVDRLVRLPRPAFLGLLDEAHDRGISLRERDLVGEVSRRRGRHDERDHGEQRKEGGSQGPDRYGFPGRSRGGRSLASAPITPAAMMTSAETKSQVTNANVTPIRP